MSTPSQDKGSGMSVFDTPEPIVAVLDLPTGTVRITASERADTVVEVRPSNERDDADVAAARHTHVEYADGRLLVRTDREHTGRGLTFGKLVESPVAWARSLLVGTGSIDVTIDLPSGSHLDVTSSGSVSARGPLGEATVTTSYGDIRLEHAGRLRLKTTHGAVTVTRGAGPAEVTTSHGGIHIGRVDGPATVKTAHGTVRIGEVTGELRLNSAYGGITVDRAPAGVIAKTAYAPLRVGEAVAGEIVLESTGGGLDLGIREGSAAWLDVSSQYGVVDVALDPGDEPRGDEQVVEVRAHTTYGDIVIHRS